MWKCPKCGEQVDSRFEVCWACGTSQDGVEDPTFCREDEGGPGEALVPTRSSTAITKGELSVTRKTSSPPVAAKSEGLTVDQLVFVGLNGRVVALHRDTGDIVWTNNQMSPGYVTFLLDGDRLIVSTNGYICCLDPLTGAIRWYNPLRGFGVGPTSLASVRGQSSPVVIQQAAAKREVNNAAPPAAFGA